jgi:hypothetical protein
MNVDLEYSGKPVKVVYRDALPAGLNVGNGRARKPDSPRNLSLAETEPLPMQPDEMSEPRIECRFVHVFL